ncbi:type III-B CRISPR module-associated Cmr3 family protein [Salinactinospora qingdaonensis]|uniref:CRISPR-associated protein Cmr3 n=1 Tax=Salinactinospora qingdaonensis TaxID=702744 RepID=A0ABP7F9A5_9ACTN
MTSSAASRAGAVRTSWVAVEPHDTVQVRDGRRFDAGTEDTTVAETVRPWPSTIAGALGAVHGGELGAVRGPVLAHKDAGGVWRPYFPTPLDLVTSEERTAVYRLRPGGPTEGTDLGELPDGPERLLEPAARLSKPAPVDGWMRAAALSAYLRGELLSGSGSAPMGRLGLSKQEPLVPERRIGIARQDRGVRSGYLYQAGHLRPNPGWGFLAEVEQPAGARELPPGPLTLGGRGRLAELSDAAPAAADTSAPRLDWPRPPEEFPEGKVLLYTATPALWPGGWRPPLPEGARLVAAAVGSPLPVATASPKRGFWGSRALRWAVPPGSVYLVRLPPDTAAATAAAWHGRALAPSADWDTESGDEPQPPTDVPRLDTAGFGVVLTGVWT